MSSLIVEVCQVDKVEPHPNADRMEIAYVKGWRTCISKGQLQAGDRVVYFPPDTVLPTSLAERLGVAKYLSSVTAATDGTRPAGGRIRVARLRGQQSYGLITKCENSDWPVGYDVASHFGVSKWEPPQICSDGDALPPHPAFHTYTDIENYRNFPNILREGEHVVFTEKLHGRNCRLGYIRDQNEAGAMEFSFMVGSHDVRRKEFSIREKACRDHNKEVVKNEDGSIKTITVTKRCRFYDALTEPVKNLLRGVSAGAHNVVLFGELYGKTCQDMWYGVDQDFRAFDLTVDGKYLDHPRKTEIFAQYGVKSVPVLFFGLFSQAKVEELVDGPTAVCAPELMGSFQGREGVVMTPVTERQDFDLGGSGRVILKAVSFAYHERKGGTEQH